MNSSAGKSTVLTLTHNPPPNNNYFPSFTTQIFTEYLFWPGINHDVPFETFSRDQISPLPSSFFFFFFTSPQ